MIFFLQCALAGLIVLLIGLLIMFRYSRKRGPDEEETIGRKWKK